MQASKCPEGTKPMLVFAGDAFDTDGEHNRLKSLLLGIYQHYSLFWRGGLKSDLICADPSVS